jgi:hypothetical protein
MIGNVRPASDAEIERLLADPRQITRFLYGAEAGSRERLDLDKAWHAIHFILNGTRLGGDPPLDFLVSEGTQIGDVDVGFGPARALSSDAVRHLAEALAPIEPQEFQRRIDLCRLDEMAIYPGRWQRDGLDVDYIVSNYRALRDLIGRLAGERLGLILYIN